MHSVGWVLQFVVTVLFTEVANYFDYTATVWNIIGIMLTRKNRSTFRNRQSNYYCVNHKSHTDRPGNEPGPLQQEVSKRVLVRHGPATAWYLQYESRALWEITWQSVVIALTLSATSLAPSHIAKIINPATKTYVATRMLCPNVPAMMSDSVAYVERASKKNCWVRYRPYV